jgi:hypothetical protein
MDGCQRTDPPDGKAPGLRAVEGLVMRPIRLLLPTLAVVLSACLAVEHHEATPENTRLWSSGDDEMKATLLPEEELPPVTHGSLSRARTSRLDDAIEQILSATLPQVQQLMDELEEARARLPVPERLASNQPVLRDWRRDHQKLYRQAIDKAYDEVVRRLQAMYEAAVAAAEAQARQLAPPRAPLDEGASGDPALDSTLATFDEVLQGALGLDDLEVRRQQDLERKLELFEVFNTFGVEHPGTGANAEEQMGGRIMLFVGGDETAEAPRAVLVFRGDGVGPPRATRIVQVMRHRIMRGKTIVSDYGWRLAPFEGSPGVPATEVVESYLVAPEVEPTMNRNSPNYDQLRDMRVVVDVQSGFFDASDRLLGGADWRVEFSISRRGDLTWQLAGGKPVFDPYCAEIAEVLRR